MTPKEFARLCEIDDKMLDGIDISEEERKERLGLIEKFNNALSRESV